MELEAGPIRHFWLASGRARLNFCRMRKTLRAQRHAVAVKGEQPPATSVLFGPGIQDSQPAEALPRRLDLPRHLERDVRSLALSDHMIRPVRLHGPHRFDVLPRRVLVLLWCEIERRILRKLRLQSVDRLLRAEPSCEHGVAQSIDVGARHAEERRSGSAGLNRDQDRPALWFCAGLTVCAQIDLVRELRAGFRLE
jgi:hypothetical protein